MPFSRLRRTPPPGTLKVVTVHADEPRSRWETVALYVALALVVALEVAPLVAGHGVPAFLQDWAWPGDREQIAPFLRTGFSPWSSDGIGHPFIYPTPWWPFVFAGALCYVFGVHFGAVACVFTALLAAACGAAGFAGLLGCGPAGRFIAGLAFAANPVVLNEVHAGHWIYLLSYALMPMIASLVLLPKSILGGWLTLGALVGIGAAQLQFLPMDLLVVAMITVVSSRHHKVRDFALIAVVAFVVASPEWAPGLFASGPSYLNALKPLPHWEIAQSVRLREAPRLLGYIGGYDRAMLSDLLRAAWWWLSAFAIIGALARRREMVTWAVAGLGGVGLVTISGMHGPAGPVLGWLFVHVPAAALFRELYHTAALAAFSMATLAAFTVDILWRNSRVFGTAAGAIALFACLILAARVSSDIPTFVLNTDARAAFARIASVAGSGRYLVLPAVYPVASSSHLLGGASPFLLPIGHHPPLATLVAEYPTSYALALLREDHTAQAHATLETLAASSITRMPEWTSSFERIVEPNLRGMIVPVTDNDLRFGVRFETLGAGERLVVEPFGVSPRSLPGTYDGQARDLRAVIGGTPIDITDPTVSPNPKDAWARTTLWPVLPSWALARPPGVFTLRGSAQLSTPPALIVAAASDGPPRSGACAIRSRLDGNFAVLACGANPVLVGTPPLVVSSVTRDGSLQEPSVTTGERGAVTVDAASEWELRARVTAVPGSVIVLRERFDPAWQISLPGLKHIEVDSYANGWVVNKHLDSELVVIRDRGAGAFFLLFFLSQLTTAVAAFAVAGRLIGSRRRPDVR